MNRFLFSFLLCCLAGAGLFSCENKPNENADKPVPQVFTPDPDSDSLDLPRETTLPDSAEIPANPEPIAPVTPSEVKKPPMPTVAELKKVTPSQEAKRALSNDAMQLYRMPPEAFYQYMQSRIPYYRGKGNLKAQTDMVRLEITEKEMIIETRKGRQTFSMQ